MAAAPPDGEEFALISRLFAPLARDPGALGLADDAAILPPAPDGYDTVVTVDTVVEGVHFLADDPPGTVAAKLVRVNVSDLAAKGAVPAAAFLAAAFPRRWKAAAIEAFAEGLGRDLEDFSLSLLGGDTVTTPGPATFTLTAIGHVRAGRMVRRSGARPGDGVYVTGTIGDAALGLRILRGEMGDVPLGRRTPLVERYRVPHPRAAFGARLPEFATAALDVSDGLVADLGHLARASGVVATIEAGRVPLSKSAARFAGRDQAVFLALLGGGDDYEIVFAAPPDAADAIAAASGATDTPVTRIGRIEAPDGGVPVRVTGADGDVLRMPSSGYSHF